MGDKTNLFSRTTQELKGAIPLVDFETVESLQCSSDIKNELKRAILVSYIESASDSAIFRYFIDYEINKQILDKLDADLSKRFQEGTCLNYTRVEYKKNESVVYIDLLYITNEPKSKNRIIPVTNSARKLKTLREELAPILTSTKVSNGNGLDFSMELLLEPVLCEKYPKGTF